MLFRSSVMSGVDGFELTEVDADDDGCACCELWDEAAAAEDEGGVGVDEDFAGTTGEDGFEEETGGFGAAEIEDAAEEGDSAFGNADEPGATGIVWDAADDDADEDTAGRDEVPLSPTVTGGVVIIFCVLGSDMRPVIHPVR